MKLIQLQSVIMAMIVSLGLRLMLDQTASARKLQAKVDLQSVLTRCDCLVASGQAPARRLLQIQSALLQLVRPPVLTVKPIIINSHHQ